MKEIVRSLLAIALLAIASAAPAAPPRWVATWASAQQVPEDRNALPPESLRDATLRQVVRTTIGGSRIRIKVSNLFGTAPLAVGAVHVARSADRASARIDPATDRAVTFGGRGAFTIPAGAEYLSDPIDLGVPPMSHLTISMYLPEPPRRQTSHPGSRATSYLVRGNSVAAPDMSGATTVAHWYQLSGIEVEAGDKVAAIVTLGDSITDGFGVQPDTDRRWPDFLARRLQANPGTRHLAVINQGMGGNRVLLDELGPNALARFDRDVLGQRGVRYLIILEGVNDLGTFFNAAGPDADGQALVADLIGAYRQMVMKAREQGIRAIGATIPPYGASTLYRATPASEAARQAVNAWIRAPGNFDAVIDFDALMRDPSHPSRIRLDLANDGLHPSIAGYEAMADAIPLSLFPPGTGNGE